MPKTKIQKFKHPVINTNLFTIPIEEASTQDDASSGRGCEKFHGSKYPTGTKCLNFVGKDGEVIANDFVNT